LGQGEVAITAKADVEKDYLVLKRASASSPSGKRGDDDYDVLADGVVVGRIFKVRATAAYAAAPGVVVQRRIYGEKPVRPPASVPYGRWRGW
jgi:hypothetical protein